MTAHPFFQTVKTPRTIAPIDRLALAILEQAVKDAMRSAPAHHESATRAKCAVGWLQSDHALAFFDLASDLFDLPINIQTVSGWIANGCKPPKRRTQKGKANPRQKRRRRARQKMRV